MKIEYNVLWLDDQIDVFIDDEYVDKIKTHLEEEGFNANIITVSKSDDFFSQLNDTIDLILTDYNMAGKNGAQIVEEVRNKSIFTEILFYTARADLQSLDKIDRITFLQTDKVTGGTHHEKVVEKAINLIDLTIKKFQHIVAMRGMIMQEVSSLDAQMLDIVTEYLQKNDEGKKQPIIDKVLNDLISFHKEKLEKSKDFKEKNKFDKVVNDPLLFSSSQRASAIEEIINSIGIENFISDFKIEIIKVRNDFAHAVFEKDNETGREYFKGKNGGIDFNEQKCIEIRKNINKHKQNLDNLQGKI
ncbi:transcriptional regulator [Bacteroidia bacterium]|nr:transcriptional regulator [Bacteroidia bacterium]GHT84629.1 transcriptional regulator [Bacteroidia bacterium]